jgi:ethanolamine kinase
MLAPRGFDIGNHFNEFAGFECDYNNYPNKSFQLQWFEWYLTASQGSKYPRRRPKNDKRTWDVKSFCRLIGKPSEEQLETLYQEVEHYSLASHLYWGLWALCQAMVSDIDFSYMDYAVLRFGEYKKRKQQVLGDSS